MIIDFHTHMFPDKIAGRTLDYLSGIFGASPFADGTYTGLCNSMGKGAVDISIALPAVTKVSQVASINGLHLRIRKDLSSLLAGFIRNVRIIKRILKEIKNLGLKGIKLHPDYQDAMFNDIRYKRIISYATELGLVVVVHAGVDIGLPSVTHCTPDMVCEVLDEVQPERLVLAHMGGWNLWDEVLAKLCGRNVYMDTAFSYGEIAWLSGAEHRWKLASEEMFLKLIRAHGADRIVFGTDSPWTDQKRAIKDIQALPLSDEDKKKILGENALQLLGLPDAE